MADTKPLGSLDYFKIITALLVIAIHTSPLTSFNVEADFVLTRVIARTAVPFFLMVTGYFLLPQYIWGKSMDYRPLFRFVQKTLLLYAIAILIFLPVNLYAGQLENIEAIDLIRMLIFDGTFYHLWYLPASVTGMLILWILGKNLTLKFFYYLLGVVRFRIGWGQLLWVYQYVSRSQSLYDTLFHIFSYTRNGIFMFLFFW